MGRECTRSNGEGYVPCTDPGAACPGRGSGLVQSFVEVAMRNPRAERATHEIVYRTCPLCEAKCGISVEVDRALGRVVTVRGDDGDAFSRGFLCPKAYGLKGLHEDPDRLRKPLRRDGSGWREIAWEEAFALAAERLGSIRDAHGAD